jgi:hypothetical protein
VKNQSGVFAQRVELDLRPLLLCDIDLDGIAGKESRRTDGIMCDAV